MVRVRVIPKEEAQRVRQVKAPGPRRIRMDQFSEYAQTVMDNPDQAAIFEELNEDPQTFVMTMRGAFRRAGVYATVRKMRKRDEVRAWLTDEPPVRVPRTLTKTTRPEAVAAAPENGRSSRRT